MNCGDVTMEKVEGQLWTRQLSRWAGVAAVLGGLLFVLAAVLHSMEPVGCIGLECETRAMRSAPGIVSILGLAASLFTLIGIAGLTLLTRQSGRHKRLADAGLISVTAGFTILLLGALIQTVFYGGDFPWIPFFVLPGTLGVIIGFVFIGVFILRSRVLPRWLGIFLGVSSVVLLAANEQTAAVLLAIPFGLAVATMGFFMWTSGERPHARAAAGG